MVDLFENWIGGRWRGPSSGHVFEVLAAPGSAPDALALGRWPRSGAEDAALALAAARSAAPRWAALGGAARQPLLARLARELARDPDPGGRIALRLGLAPSELAPHLAHDPDAIEPAPPQLGGAAIAVCALHWSELEIRALRRTLGLLGAGFAVVVIPDARLPMVGDALARALERADLPPGVAAVVHDDGWSALHALLDAPDVVRLAAAAPARELERLAGVARRARPELALDLDVLRCASRVVPETSDPAAEAARTAELAVGRAAALSGQLPGQIGRVLCAERRLSEFTRELLLRLEFHSEAPIPPIDPDLLGYLRSARELGLGEGATLIGGGPSVRAPAAGAELAPWPPTGWDATLWASVFTNVEPATRLARLSRPAPLLRLVRVPSAAAGELCLRRLDLDPEPEDV